MNWVRVASLTVSTTALNFNLNILINNAILIELQTVVDSSNSQPVTRNKIN